MKKIEVAITEQSILNDTIKLIEQRKEDSFWNLNTSITKETIKSLQPTVGDVEIHIAYDAFYYSKKLNTMIQELEELLLKSKTK